jgi:DNA-directed RNA polymerase alpha subunit
MSNFTYDPATDPLHPYLFADVADIPVEPVGPAATRVYNCLWLADACYIGDVVVKSEEYWLAQYNFGKVALKALKLGLAKIGLRLGSDLPDWPPTPERA